MCEQYHVVWSRESGLVEVYTPDGKPVPSGNPMGVSYADRKMTEEEAQRAATIRAATFEVID